MATPRNLLAENYIPYVMQNGGFNSDKPIETSSDLTVGGDLNVTGDIVVDDVTIDALTVTGNTILGNAVTDTTTITGATTITSTAALSFAVGPTAAGVTPVFSVDSSTSSAVAGLKITGAATGGTVAIVTTDSGADTNLTINAKGTGTIGIGSVSTGRVTITPVSTLTGFVTMTAGFTSAANAILKSGTAVPATAGAVAAGAPITLYSSSITIEITSDAPTHTRPKGSICINTGGSSGSTRMYVNTDSGTTWTSFTTAA